MSHTPSRAVYPGRRENDMKDLEQIIREEITRLETEYQQNREAFSRNNYDTLHQMWARECRDKLSELKHVLELAGCNEY